MPIHDLDARIRGVPAGMASLPVEALAGRGWTPFDGNMSLPMLTLSETAFAANTDLMLRYVRSKGAHIAPHAKTPMAPMLAHELVAAGAWGTTVADIRQLAVFLHSGLRRFLIANEIGGLAQAQALARLLCAYPDAEVCLFVDSDDLLAALAQTWSERQDLPAIGMLLHVGAGRAGVRTNEAAATLLAAMLAHETTLLRVAGIGLYEGTAATSDPAETATAIAALVARATEAFRAMRRGVGDARDLIFSAGGSAYFDLVLEGAEVGQVLGPETIFVFRSGVIYFHDHGLYQRAAEAMDRRGGFSIDGKRTALAESLQPALRIWANLLSLPEPGLAICGMGARDAGSDHDLPIPLAVYRNGQFLNSAKDMRVAKLNDQHAFMHVPRDCPLQIGDVIEFGISHPCTTFDKYRWIFALDDTLKVTRAIPTFFG